MPRASRANTLPWPGSAASRKSAFPTTHPCPGPEPFDDWRMTRADLPRYVEMILAAREAAAPFPVRLGLECDFIVGQESVDRRIRRRRALGLPHRQRPLPRAGLGRGRPEVDRALLRVRHRRRGDLGALLAHLRALRRQRPVRLRRAPRPRQEVRAIVRPVTCAATTSRRLPPPSATGVAMEVSTAGIAQAGGRTLSVGGIPARAHARRRTCRWSSTRTPTRPNEVGRDFERAGEAVRAAGYTHTARFVGSAAHAGAAGVNRGFVPKERSNSQDGRPGVRPHKQDLKSEVGAKIPPPRKFHPRITFERCLRFNKHITVTSVFTQMKTLLVLCLATVGFASFASAEETVVVHHRHRVMHHHYHHHHSDVTVVHHEGINRGSSPNHAPGSPAREKRAGRPVDVFIIKKGRGGSPSRPYLSGR